MEEFLNAKEKLNHSIIKINEMIHHINGLNSHGYKIDTTKLESQKQEYTDLIQSVENLLIEQTTILNSKADEIKA